jgi:SAM-dependent methyltransferase
VKCGDFGIQASALLSRGTSMGTIAENRKKWASHRWELGGHEWSPGGTSLGTEMLWWRSLRPRLHALLPTGSLLEIAPGFGRWTEYLLREADRLIGVDTTERCVETCRERFAGSRAQFFVNDGCTLPMVADASVDVVFSFDSLVHVELPEIFTTRDRRNRD